MKLFLGRSNTSANSPSNPTNARPTPLQVSHGIDIFPLFARRDRPPQRTLHVSSHEPVSRLLRRRATLAKVRDKAFREPDGDVDFVRFVGGFQAFGQVAGAGGDGDEVGVEGEVLLGEGEGGGEVFCRGRSVLRAWKVVAAED